MKLEIESRYKKTVLFLYTKTEKGKLTETYIKSSWHQRAIDHYSLEEQRNTLAVLSRILNSIHSSLNQQHFSICFSFFLVLLLHFLFVYLRLSVSFLVSPSILTRPITWTLGCQTAIMSQHQHQETAEVDVSGLMLLADVMIELERMENIWIIPKEAKNKK